MRPDRALAYRNAWLAAGLGFIALVVYLSLTPNPIDAGRMGEVKVGHFIAYAWLMLWFSQFHKSIASRIGFALAFCALGVGLEYAQGTTGYRTFAYSDMRDNVLGVLAGWVLGSTALGNALVFVEARFMKLRRTHAAWALKLWVMATVFLLPFMEPLQVLGWIAMGGVFGGVWKMLPEETEAPVQKLPYQDQYAHMEVPRRDAAQGGREKAGGDPPA